MKASWYEEEEDAIRASKGLMTLDELCDAVSKARQELGVAGWHPKHSVDSKRRELGIDRIMKRRR